MDVLNEAHLRIFVYTKRHDEPRLLKQLAVHDVADTADVINDGIVNLHRGVAQPVAVKAARADPYVRNQSLLLDILDRLSLSQLRPPTPFLLSEHGSHHDVDQEHIDDVR